MSMITTSAKSQNILARLATRAAFVAHRRLWRLRAVTLGVRAIVLDDAGRVLLVRHTYTPGWYFPGGGVDRGETAEDAVIRELREEGAMECLGRPVLHGIYRHVALERDHVACYVIRDVAPIPGARPDWEIAEAGFFPTDTLPSGTTNATRARLDEVLRGAPIATEW
jgi:8-oxo-dGTP pyrophosphatase MutT (NUDIX family)